jgi:hypothetical protein
VNLPKTLAEDGLRVRFCVKPLEGVVSLHMWGIPVEIVETERLGADGQENQRASEESAPAPGEP